jgi:membrane-bound lytic murein transglycosylase D
MKTMLKSKKKKVGYVAYGLLLLTTPAFTSLSQDAYSFNAPGYYAEKPRNWFADTTAANADSLKITITNESAKSLKAPVVKLNANAKKFVSDYIRKNAEDLAEIKNKSHRYFAVMDSVFTAYKLPVQLKYLAVVESELNTKAVSRVGAVGMWQFMPGTAKTLGLKVTHKYDERKLFYKSTKAAAKYLNDLYSQFGDWLLVLAAYNSGPGPVYAAIKKSGSRNFWRLQQYLPLETKLHVKRFVGTHYFFEGEGSVTTLTKNEATEYLKALAKFKEELSKEEINAEDNASLPVAISQ